MPRAALTRSFLHRVICPPSARKVDFFDIRQPGFMLEVRNSGGKTYYQRYRDCRGRERQFKIGPAGALTLRQARRKARQVVAEALLGSDPHQRRQELRTIPTLTEFVRDRYMAFAQAAKRSWQTDETLLRLHILPALGKFPLDDISN